MFPLDLLAARVDDGLVFPLLARFLLFASRVSGSRRKAPRKKVDETYVPLCKEVVQIGIPYLDWGELEKSQKFLLLVRSLLEQFLDL